MFDNLIENFRSKIGSDWFFGNKINSERFGLSNSNFNKDEKDIITSKLNGNIFGTLFRRDSKETRCEYERVGMFPRVTGDVEGFNIENGNHIEMWPSPKLRSPCKMLSISMSPEKIEEVVDKFIRVISEDHCSTRFDPVREGKIICSI